VDTGAKTLENRRLYTYACMPLPARPIPTHKPQEVSSFYANSRSTSVCTHLQSEVVSSSCLRVILCAYTSRFMHAGSSTHVFVHRQIRSFWPEVYIYCIHANLNIQTQFMHITSSCIHVNPKHPKFTGISRFHSIFMNKGKVPNGAGRMRLSEHPAHVLFLAHVSPVAVSNAINIALEPKVLP
jgi:hypothetical protein